MVTIIRDINGDKKIIEEKDCCGDRTQAIITMLLNMKTDYLMGSKQVFSKKAVSKKIDEIKTRFNL